MFLAVLAFMGVKPGKGAHPHLNGCRHPNAYQPQVLVVTTMEK
jgi:hypothetical protein